MQDSKLLRNVQCGACWSGANLYHAGHLDTQKCSYCDAPKHTIKHIIWHCPQHNVKRKALDPELAQFGSDTRPEPLLHGIAPALHHTDGHTYWGIPLPPDTPPRIINLTGATDHPPDFRQALATFTDPFNLNSRQLFDRLRYTPNMQDPPTPRRIEALPPNRPTIHTDGGLLSPTDNK